MATWYKLLLLAWVVTVVPVAWLAYAFSGGHFVFPDVSVFGFAEWVEFIPPFVWALSPVLLAPFGLRRRKANPSLE